MTTKLTDTEIEAMVSACVNKVHDIKYDEFIKEIENISDDDSIEGYGKFAVLLQYVFNSTHEIVKDVVTQALIEYNKN